MTKTPESEMVTIMMETEMVEFEALSGDLVFPTVEVGVPSEDLKVLTGEVGVSVEDSTLLGVLPKSFATGEQIWSAEKTVKGNFDLLSHLFAVRSQKQWFSASRQERQVV